jgi:hypothetical protein
MRERPAAGVLTNKRRDGSRKAFCCAFLVPGPSYGGACTTDAQCPQNGGRWHKLDNTTPVCACWAFNAQETRSPDVCTYR